MGRRRADTAVARTRRKAGEVNKAPAATTGDAKVERQRRLIEVQRLILDGIDDERIVQWLTTEITQADADALKARGLVVLVKPWKVTDTTAREYLVAAQRPWAAQLDPDKAAAKHARNRQRLLHQYEMANREGERHAAIKAALAICDLDNTVEGLRTASVQIPVDDDDTDLEGAIEMADHLTGMVAMARRRGLIPARTDEVIDVEPSEATAAGADDQHPEVVEDAPEPAVAGDPVN